MGEGEAVAVEEEEGVQELVAAVEVGACGCSC